MAERGRDPMVMVPVTRIVPPLSMTTFFAMSTPLAMSVFTLPVPPAEGRIERAIGVVARDREVGAADRQRRRPTTTMPLSGLHRHREGPVAPAEEIRGGLALRAEGGVDVAIGLVAHDGEVIVAADACGAHHDDAAVAQQRRAEGGVRAAGDIGGDQPAVAEGLIEVAVGRRSAPS